MAERILIFGPFAWSSGQNEVYVELALDHKAKGDDVHIIQCRRELETCDPNPSHRLTTCIACVSTGTLSMDLAGVAKSNRHALDLQEEIHSAAIPHFKTLDELKAFQWKSVNIGWAVTGYLVDRVGDARPDMEACQPQIHKMIQLYASVYESVQRTIRRLKPTTLYVFNGRSGLLNAAMHAGKNAGVKTWICERNHYKEFILIDGTFSADLHYGQKQLIEYVEKMKKDPEAKSIGEDWFERTRRGNKEEYFCYLDRQQKGALPVGFTTSRINIALFGSSEYELAAVPGWENPLFESQLEAIHFILKNVTDPKIQFYLRVHPNLAGHENTQVREIRKLKYPNLTVIAAEAPCDSYALLDACNKVVTFGSTIGIEAVYWGKPSVLVGRNIYEVLDGCYLPKDKADLIRLMTEPLQPKPRERALGYAYWIRTRGQPLRFVEPQNPITGRLAHYRGVDLKPRKSGLWAIRWMSRWERHVVRRWKSLMIKEAPDGR